MADRREFRDLVAPERAHEVIDSLDLTADSEHVPLREARGRILAERVDAAIDVPGFDRATVDGFAVRARDTFGADEADPAHLALAGTIHAGQKPAMTVDDGQAVEISTGAVLPDGADAVVMVERTDRTDRAVHNGMSAGAEHATDESVLVRTAVTPGEGVMFAGADISAGERAFGPGTQLTARDIGLLSALGQSEVPVRGRPIVGIVSTGDELVRPDGVPEDAAGQIYDVNSYTTAAAVEAAGGRPLLYPHVGDDYDAMERVLLEAAEDCHLVLSSGSTSASAVDVIYRIVEERGELLLHGVAVKPGKPMLVGTLGGAAYIGLPGYPVSALTIFRAFVAPPLRKAAGLPESRTATVTGRMASRERYAEGRRRLLPVGLVDDGDGTTLVYPVDRGSGATRSLVEADGIVEVPAEVEYVDVGETVDVELFSPDVRPPTLLGVGEDDPVLTRLLDRLDRPRYLGVGSREGRRRLREGVPDVAVVAGPSATSPDTDALDLGGWRREWGLAVPTDNPDAVMGLADLVDRDLRFVNRTQASGMHGSLVKALGEVAEDRDMEQATVMESIRGFDRGLRGHESPARRVLAGEADVGVALRTTAVTLDLGFVPVGKETVSVLAAQNRGEKRGVEQLETALSGIDDILDDVPGFERR